MAPFQQSSSSTSRISYIIAFLLFILVCQIAYNSINNSTNITLRSDNKPSSSSTSSTTSNSPASSTTTSSSTSSTASSIFSSLSKLTTSDKKRPEDELFGTMYYLTHKSPPSMPSVRLTPEEEKRLNPSRTPDTIYGGKLDKPHLGGFTERDEMGLSMNLFNYMMGPMTIKSVIDVGCGKGISTKEFLDRGARVLCVEGSHDGVEQSLLPSSMIVEHDFSRGPWWPEETYDATWSVEFLEHVGRPYMMNYLPIFKKSALVLVTSSGFGGWHHVEVHAQWWWRARMEAQGFRFSPELTERFRRIASDGTLINPNLASGQAQHLAHGLQVFINPIVASLPQHHHLFGGGGCYDDSIDNNNGGRECTGVDALPGDYLPLLDCSWDPNSKATILKCEKNPKATIPNQKFIPEN